MRLLSHPYEKENRKHSPISIIVNHKRDPAIRHDSIPFQVSLSVLWSFFRFIHRFGDDKNLRSFFLEALNQLFGTLAELVRVEK